jgi:hypothetical protein
LIFSTNFFKNSAFSAFSACGLLGLLLLALLDLRLDLLEELFKEGLLVSLAVLSFFSALFCLRS